MADEQTTISTHQRISVAYHDTLDRLRHATINGDPEAALNWAAVANNLLDQSVKELKMLIEGYNAETGRIKAITSKDFPLGPGAVEALQPLVEQAIREVGNSPDVLNGQPQLPAAPPAIQVPEGFGIQ